MKNSMLFSLSLSLWTCRKPNRIGACVNAKRTSDDLSATDSSMLSNADTWSLIPYGTPRQKDTVTRQFYTDNYYKIIQLLKRPMKMCPTSQQHTSKKNKTKEQLLSNSIGSLVLFISILWYESSNSLTHSGHADFVCSLCRLCWSLLCWHVICRKLIHDRDDN